MNIEVIGTWTVYKDITQVKRGFKHIKCVCKCGLIAYKDPHLVKYKKLKKCKQCYLNRDPRIPQIGERFGRLVMTGQSYLNKHGQLLYTSVCDCGKIVNCPKQCLFNGKTHGCGQNCPIFINVSDVHPGEKYGAWTVLNDSIQQKSGKIFECRCVCGTIKYHRAFTLRSGENVFCKGCPVREKELELKPGETFGSWTVLTGIRKSSSNKTFEVMCRCGYITYHRKQTLVTGHSTQCYNCYRDSIRGIKK